MANLYSDVLKRIPQKTANDGARKYRETHSIYDWYHPDQTEESAKKYLEDYPYDPLDQEALFLVHPYGKEREDIKYVISCKWKMSVYQYRVRYNGDEDVYTVRSAKASTLFDLVEQYRLTAVGLDGLRSKYTKDTALSHLMYPIAWPKKYKDRCYHGLLGREDAEKVLQEKFIEHNNYSPFLIRDSLTEPGKLIMSGMFVNKSDRSKKFHHCFINFKDGIFETLNCRGSQLLSLAKSIEDMYKKHGELMTLKAIDREGYHGVDIDVLEHFLPPAINTMSESAIETFREALEEGYENFHHVRVMVVGYHGAGKSSLTKRLLRENAEHVQSTEGVEIFTKRGRFQISDNKWIKYDGKQENENEILERIARYLTQRFPEGVPTYLSLSGVRETETSDYMQPYASPQKNDAPQRFSRQDPVDIGGMSSIQKRPESQNNISRSPDLRIKPPFRYSSPLLQRNVPNRANPKSDKPGAFTRPPRSYPDPRIGKIQPESESSSDEEDENTANNSYSNQFTAVISDLKHKFSTSTEAQMPVRKPVVEDEDLKGSDECKMDCHKSLDRGFSYDDDSVDQSQKEQALKNDLEELLQMSAKFLQNETGSITFWDFAGQTVFQTTHQAFMSSKAVYLLVTDASRPMDEQVDDDDNNKTVRDFLKFWFNTIHTYCSESQPGSPKVLVVSTHKDQLQKGDKEIEEHNRAIKRVVRKKMLSPHLVPEMFCVDCTNEDEEVFDKIRSKILEIAEKENIRSQRIPTSWIYLERKITNLQKEGRKILNFAEIKKLNKFCPLQLKDVKEIKVFLQFHHAIGNMLYYDEKGLDDIIILDPQWLVDAFKCLITSEKFFESSGQLADSLVEEMRKTGYLSMQIIETLWGERDDTSYLENKEHIIKILERMDIISRPRRYMEDGESSQEMSTFLVPCMMNEDSSNISGKWLKNANNVPALGFYFKDEFMPPAVFYRLLAACMAKFPAVEQNYIPLVFSNTAVFRLDKFNFLLLAHNDYLIRAWVITFSNIADRRSSIRYTIKKFLEESLTIILEIYTSCTACSVHKLTKRCASCRICNANFPFRVVVQCPRCLSSEMSFKGLHFWGDLTSNESVVCVDHEEVHVIESSEILDFWKLHSDNLTLSRKGLQSVPETPLSLSYQRLGRLARRVSGYWENIAYQLELGDNFVETTKQNFPHLASDCCFQTLRKWFEKTPKEKRNLQTLDNVFAELDIDRETLQALDTAVIEWGESKHLEGKVSNRGIDIICNRLGKKSYQLAIELGLTPEEIERIQMDFRTSIDRSREFINKWRQYEQNESKRTYKVLLQALATVEVDNVMDILSLIY